MPIPDLTTLTATEAAAEIARGVISAEDYTSACLERIAALDGDVHAFIHLDRDHALAQARARDAYKAEGRRLGPLHGVPVGIKDIFDTDDYPTECGAQPLAGRRPSADAAAVRRLRDAGAVIIGKTVTTECAYFHPGKTRNPHDLQRTPGGSSSGSAAAVAAAMVPLAIGSQTNGSMIRPAAFCGVFGIKPSHGLISRAGALTLSRALDHVGAFARSLDDLALILDVLAGHDADDADTRFYAASNFRAALAEPPPIPPSFAFVRTPMWDKADAEARSGLEDLAKELGAREVDLPDSFRAAWDAQRAIMAVDMAFNLGDHRRQRRREDQQGVAGFRRRRPQSDRRRLSGGPARCAPLCRCLGGNIRATCRRNTHSVGPRRRARRHGDRRPGVLYVLDADRPAGAQLTDPGRARAGCQSGCN